MSKVFAAVAFTAAIPPSHAFFTQQDAEFDAAYNESQIDQILDRLEREDAAYAAFRNYSEELAHDAGMGVDEDEDGPYMLDDPDDLEDGDYDDDLDDEYEDDDTAVDLSDSEWDDDDENEAARLAYEENFV